MTKIPLTLTADDVHKFYANNGYATNMLGYSENDYIAARCLVHHAIFRGFGLASEAIEKALKALLFLEIKGGKWQTWHNPYDLKQKLKSVNSNWGRLDSYDELFKRLYGHYQRRYHDNNNKSKSQSGSELDEIDELYFQLWDHLPIPDEAKFRHSFFSTLFEIEFRDDGWFLLYDRIHNERLRIDNKAFGKRKEDLFQRFTEVKNHLYPTEE